MEEFVQIWRLLTALVAIVLGVHLLQVAARTRALPELIFGVSILLPALGVILREVILVQDLSAESESPLMMRVATVAIFVAGPIGLYLGTWRVFRPGRLWAGALCATGCAVLLAAPVLRLTSHSAGPGQPPLAVVVAFAGSYLWMACEAFLYYRQMRRRLKLGTGDPVTATQFLLWGVSSACGATNVLCTLATLILFGQRMSEVPRLNALDPVLGGAWVLCLYLAFFPPLSLQDLLHRRSISEAA